MCDAEGELDVALLSLPYFAFWAVLLGLLEWRSGAEEADRPRSTRAVYTNPAYRQRLLL